MKTVRMFKLNIGELKLRMLEPVKQNLIEK
jgi:hypothetical protein